MNAHAQARPRARIISASKMKLWSPETVFGINYQLQILQIGAPGPPGLPRGHPCILGKFMKKSS